MDHESALDDDCFAEVSPEISSRIGTGGMGEVYRAHDKTLNRDVAIKFLLPAAISSVYKQAADGTGTVDRLSTSGTPQWSASITPDGTWVAAVERLPRTAAKVVFLPLTRDVVRASSKQAARVSQSPMEPLAETKFRGEVPNFSPNGRYIVYPSDESGRYEIYIRPFPRVANGRWQISTAGGTRPVWARSGRELFYLDASRTA